MPKCVNYPSATYKGTEPSPKGVGHCARGESVGTEMLGRNGHPWVVRKTKKGIKRWMPVKGVPSVKLTPLCFRMVIGYYKDDEDDEEIRPPATPATLKKFMQKASVWNYFNISLRDMGIRDGRRGVYKIRLGKIAPKNIKRVKILPAPIHTPTFWEKLTKKYSGSSYHPTYVIVVDVVKVPVIKVPPKELYGREYFREFAETFYMDTLTQVNHDMMSADGWIVYNKSAPFKGELTLLQMGTNILPDYRKFTL